MKNMYIFKNLFFRLIIYSSKVFLLDFHNISERHSIFKKNIMVLQNSDQIKPHLKTLFVKFTKNSNFAKYCFEAKERQNI